MPETVLVAAILCLLATGLTAAAGEPAAGYRGIWYSIGQDKGHGPKYSGGLGTYPANMLPMACHDAAAQMTWFVYGGTTAASRTDLQIMIGGWDHRDGTVIRPVTIRDSDGFKDAHANPALTVGAGGHLYVVSATRHSFEGRIYRSDRPHDPRHWSVVHRGYLAYPQSWYHPRVGHVVLHTRYQGSRRFLYSIRSENGRTWDEPVCHARFKGHYQNSAMLPDGTIVTAFNYHPRGVDKRTNIYCLVSRDGGRSWTTAGGEAVATPLKKPANPALVLDAAARGELVYIMDLAVDADGRPVVLYLTSHHAATGPKGDPRTWRTLQLTRSGWRERTITTSTNNYDCGGLIVDETTWTVIGPTAPGPQAAMTGGEMHRWTSTDAGATWEDRALTAGSRANHTYARRAIPHHPDFLAFWADGDASQPSDSSIYVTDAEGTVYRLPREMRGAAQRPAVLKRGR